MEVTIRRSRGLCEHPPPKPRSPQGNVDSVRMTFCICFLRLCKEVPQPRQLTDRNVFPTLLDLKS